MNRTKMEWVHMDLFQYLSLVGLIIGVAFAVFKTHREDMRNHREDINTHREDMRKLDEKWDNSMKNMEMLHRDDMRTHREDMKNIDAKWENLFKMLLIKQKNAD